MPSQLPYTRMAQVAPHTPPRRERDSDDQPPPPGALTPQQVGQLSRMLGVFSGPGQPQFTAEQLFAYLRGVQNKWVVKTCGWIESSDVQVWIQTGFRHFTEIGQCLNDSKLWEIHGILCKLIFGGACLQTPLEGIVFGGQKPVKFFPGGYLTYISI